MAAGRLHSTQLSVESLEDRELLASHLTASLSADGLLRVKGTDRADQIVLRQEHGRISVDQTRIQVSGSGRFTRVDASDVRRIVVRGQDGNDRITLTGLGRRSLLRPVIVFAGGGNDVVHGGPGDERLYGDGGNDRLHGHGGNDRVHGGAGNDRLDGGSGNDTLLGAAGNDTLHGRIGNDKLYGNAGNDRQYAETGRDRLDGGTGRNVLSGGSGNDQLFTRTGRDGLNGGSGRDTARFLDSAASRSTRGRADSIQGLEHFFTQTPRFSSSTPKASTTAPVRAPAPAPFATEVQRVIQLTNDYRRNHGLQSLRVNSRLTEAARYQAEYMARTGHYAHTNRDGRGVVERVRVAGYSYYWLGENIHAYDPANGRTLGINRTYSLQELGDYYFDGWRVSPSHDQNLLSSHAVEIGVALARAASGRIYAVQVFGRPS